MNVKKIPYDEEGRVETGPVQFGDDWPGVFIRGDNANYYAFMLEKTLSGEIDVIEEMTIKDLIKTLQSCVVK